MNSQHAANDLTQEDLHPVYLGVSSKMYMGYAESLSWLRALRDEVDTRGELAASRVVPFVIPSFPVLPAAAKIVADSPILLGAQNSGWADGAWTGEVSPLMLAEVGVRWVEVGHAERRRYFHEDDAMVRRKVSAIQAAGMTALLCVGEATRAEPADAAATVYRQIQSATNEWQNVEPLVIAYEPVWAIGASEPADPVYVSGVVYQLRELLGRHGLAELPIIYGGSAAPGLLPQLEHVSGLFLGRFAHDPANFGAVLDEALQRAG